MNRNEKRQSNGGLVGRNIKLICSACGDTMLEHISRGDSRLCIRCIARELEAAKTQLADIAQDEACAEGRHRLVWRRHRTGRGWYQVCSACGAPRPHVAVAKEVV